MFSLLIFQENKAENVIKQIFKKVIQDNGCFPHAEQILIAMLSADHHHIKKHATQHIKNVKGRVNDGTLKIEVPKVIFEANYNIKNIIHRKIVVVTELPITIHEQDAILIIDC